MKTFNSNYLGMVIDNNDPEFRGRVQVFIPHIMPTLYKGWNKEGQNITINCVGDNMPKGLTSEIVDRLKKILPWAEAASPIVGQSAPGGAMSAPPSNSPGGNGGGSGGGSGGSGSSDGGTGSDTTPTVEGSEAPPNTANKAGNPAGPLNFDQTPTAVPAGSLPPGTSCTLPTEGGHVDMKNLKPKFIQRLNGFYKEAAALNYKVICCSGFRSKEKQAALYAKIGSPGCARPGNSAHEYGIAADLKVTGNGVSITQISTKADISSNKDTPAFRALLAKYGLHQPLHPDNHPSGPEKWHIEPIETPRAGGPRGPEACTRVAGLMSGDLVPSVAETPSSSQFPASANPLEHKSPSNSDTANPTSPVTGEVPVIPVPNSMSGSQPPTGGTGTPITTGPTTGATPVTPAPTGGGIAQLAKDRTAYFEKELQDPQVLDRIEYVTQKEGGASGRLIFETAVNRAFFRNRTLKATLFQKAYFHDATKDPNATKTVPHTKFTLDLIQKVIYNGANETNLATDNVYNDKNLFAKKFIDGGATGDWFDLLKGQKITDPGKIISLSTTPGNGNQEFIYRKDGHGDAYSKDGMRAKEYALKYNIQPTSPSNFNSDRPLPPEIKDASKSPLTDKPLNTLTPNPPATVNKTDPHGQTVIKNTNDAAKGMFAFPGVGAMVWIFFREGNPLFPVYFAASYSTAEWKSAYNGSSLNPEGTNNGTTGTQLANSMRLNPNAGGGLEFTHVKDASDPSGAHDKAVAMIYGDDGSNMMFSKGYHQIYTRHDRRSQVDGHLYNIIGGAEEKWVEDDSSVNIRGNVTIKVGKVDIESMEVMKELSDFSKQLNDTLMSNSAK